MISIPLSTTLDEAVAAEVRAEMGRRRVSIRSLANQIDGVSREWLSRRVNGAIPMTPDDIGAVCAPLGVAPAELVRRASALLDSGQPAA